MKKRRTSLEPIGFDSGGERGAGHWTMGRDLADDVALTDDRRPKFARHLRRNHKAHLNRRLHVKGLLGQEQQT